MNTFTKLQAFCVAYWSGRCAETLWRSGHHGWELFTASVGAVFFLVLLSPYLNTKQKTPGSPAKGLRG